MIFFRVFQHLLPRARAWRLTITKQLRELFEGLAKESEELKEFFDLIWLDVFPDSTRELNAWEEQFALRSTGGTEQERRDRLAATWRALGGQDPRYIQDTLQGAGFDVYVHEWWEPGSEAAPDVKACATARNPLLWLTTDNPAPGSGESVTCAEPDATCGNPEATARVGAASGGIPGYPLVNPGGSVRRALTVTCGSPASTCNGAAVTSGHYLSTERVPREIVIPTDPTKWPYFLYIGGAVFGEQATLAASRRDEFEALCLKICPAQQWLGIIVTYA